MGISWYYGQDGRRKGPVTQDDLKTALGRGEIARDTLVWCEGMAQWRALEDVEALRPLLAELPPPPPPPPPVAPPPVATPPAPPPPAPPPAGVGTAEVTAEALLAAALRAVATAEAPRTAAVPGENAPGETPPPADAPPAEAPRGEPQPARPSRAGAAATWVGQELIKAFINSLFTRPGITVVIALVVVGGGILVAVQPDSKPMVESEPELEKPVAMGQLRIDANPWGEVEWIRRADGSAVELSTARTTPFTAAVPAGRYQAQVKYPHGPVAKRCDLRVETGRLATCWLDLAPVNAKSYLQKIGW